MKHNSCELDLPYPPIEIEGQNPRYAQILLHDYAGPHGELTALTQYFYQYFIINNQYSNFARELECISIVEMKHMKMLGEIIVLLGGNPLLRTIAPRRNIYWCGNNISPTQDIKNFLIQNIAGENLAIENYRKHIAMINDVKIKAILNRIIKDEENHISIFNKYLKEFS